MAVKVLVTGGMGFIGSNFIRYLLKEIGGVIVMNCDKLTYAGNPANLVDVAAMHEYTVTHEDISDRVAMDRLIGSFEPDLIFNFAAESHVDRSIVDCSPFVESNVAGTAVLLDMVRQYEIKRFVQVSTDEVYGTLLPGDPLWTEESPLLPNSPYAASKASADFLVRSFYRTHGLSVVTTRSSNNYGPWQHVEKFIPVIITRAVQDKPIPVYGKGENVRDWLYVHDNCRGIWLAGTEGESGETYNFGGGAEVQNIELCKTVLDVLGKPYDLIEFVADRPGHDLRYGLCYDKARDKLGWRPKVTYDSGLSKTVQWYVKHEDWWRELLEMS